MRKFFLAIFFILLFILCILFLLQFFPSNKNKHVDENLYLSKPKSEELVTHPRVANSMHHQVKDAKKNGSGHSYAYRSYRYRTEPTSAAVSDSEPVTSAAPAILIPATATTPPAPSSESALKYVLFSVTYDAQMIAGETKSLQLRMSPRNELAKLEKALNENKIQQSQIKEIEKVQSNYRYTSAHLVAQNNCVTIEKKMPEEDKVYLPNVNESPADQIWQWDLTAPEIPKDKMCHLSLFIRFCMNQNDCLPMQNPDKEFNINVEITVGQKIYKWFTGFGEVAHTVVTIITLLGLLGVWQIFKWFKRKKSRNS